MEFMQQALSENSTDKYFVTYNELGFVNHMAHGIVALHRLGAKKSEINAFVKHYSSILDPRGGRINQMHLDNGEGIEELLGERKGYYTLLDHYKDLLAEEYGGSYEKFLRGEFPKRIPGLAAGLLHGVIQIGYGVAAEHRQVVCEGMAFLHYSYKPLVTSPNIPDIHTLGQGTLGVLELLEVIHTEGKIAAGVETHGDDMVNYVHQIKIPEHILNAPEVERLNGLLKWLVSGLIVIYQSFPMKNNFFILHGVTSSWALAQVLPLLDDWDNCLHAVRTFLCAVLTVYIGAGAPKPDVELLERRDVSNLTWDDVRARICGMDASTDEHIFKLVQVCYDMSKINDDKKMDGIFKRASLTAMENPLYFG